jgi:hypothetical protein
VLVILRAFPGQRVVEVLGQAEVVDLLDRPIRVLDAEVLLDREPELRDELVDVDVAIALDVVLLVETVVLQRRPLLPPRTRRWPGRLLSAPSARPALRRSVWWLRLIERG